MASLHRIHTRDSALLSRPNDLFEFSGAILQHAWNYERGRDSKRQESDLIDWLNLLMYYAPQQLSVILYVELKGRDTGISRFDGKSG